MRDPVLLPSDCHAVWLETTDSTNEEAKRMAVAGAPQYTVVIAREQTRGRGRHGRMWLSPPGNLYASVILRPACRPAVAAQIGFVAALALRDVVSDLVGDRADVRCKWPNDILVEGRKVSGILLECASDGGERIDWVVLGMGVNIVSVPSGIDRPATCLRDHGVASCTPEIFLKTWMPAFMTWYAHWSGRGFVDIREAWLSHAAGRGAAIEVRLGSETIRGQFVDLDPSGALVVDAAKGRRLVAAGEVFAVGS